MEGVGRATGSLTVGGTHLTSVEVEAEIVRLSNILTRVASSRSHGEFAPILIDFSIGSHLLLAALSRVSLNCALIDASLPSRQIELQLRQLNSRVMYFLPGSQRKRMAVFSGIRYRDLERFGGNTAKRHSRSTNSSVALFSSGSTGEPKGVVFDWDKIHEIVDWRDPLDLTQVSSRRVLNLSPLNWTVGLFHAISLNFGVDVVSHNPLSMSMNQLIDEIRRTEVERIYLGANFARVFATAVDNYKGPAIKTLKKLVIGSGHISWELVNRFKGFVSSDAEFVHSYGSTEAVGMLSNSWPIGMIPRTGRVSLGPLGNADGIRLEDTDDKGVFQVVATRRIAERYLRESTTNQQFITLPDGTRGWRSGDLIRLEGESCEIFFEGRVDDIVKNSDHLVSLVAIEREINSLPRVELSAARRFSHDGRDSVVAFVQLPKRNPTTEAQIVSSLRKRLPSYSVPHRVILCDQIPLTNRGKPDLEKLRALFLSNN